MLRGWVIQDPSTGKYFYSSQRRVMNWTTVRCRLFWSIEEAQVLYRACNFALPIEIMPAVVLVVEREGDTQGVGDR